MSLSSIEILGFRGFATKQKLEIALPDGNTPGSGLTIIVGANNSGKSTITEAFRGWETRRGITSRASLRGAVIGKQAVS